MSATKESSSIGKYRWRTERLAVVLYQNTVFLDMTTCTVAARLKEDPASMFMVEKVLSTLRSLLSWEWRQLGASKPLYRQTTQHYTTEDVDFALKEVVSVFQYTTFHFQPNQPFCYSLPGFCYDIFYPLLCCSIPEQTRTRLQRRYRLFPLQRSVQCTGAHCATSQKVAALIPDGVIGMFHWHNPSGRTVVLG